MFKSPMIKVDELFLNMEKVLFEEDSFPQIFIISFPKKRLKLSKIKGESSLGSTSILASLISIPIISSTEMEFSAAGPIHFEVFGNKSFPDSVAVKMIFSSGINSDYLEFASFFDSICSPGLQWTDINNASNSPIAPNPIRRLPKVKKKTKSAFKKINTAEGTDSLNDFISSTDLSISESLESPKHVLLEDQESCLLTSDNVMDGIR